MTVTSKKRQTGIYVGDGVVKAFAFDFKVFSADDVAVVVDGSTLVSGYSVALNGDQDAAPGGTVTLSATPASGAKLRVKSAVDATQAISLQSLGGFFPQIITDALDRLTILVQQLTPSEDPADLEPTGAASIVLAQYTAPGTGSTTALTATAGATSTALTATNDGDEDASLVLQAAGGVTLNGGMVVNDGATFNGGVVANNGLTARSASNSILASVGLSGYGALMAQSSGTVESYVFFKNGTKEVARIESTGANSNTSMTFSTLSTMGLIESRWVLGGGGLTPAADNIYPLGSPSKRCSVLYAATGTINTSDEREKTFLTTEDAERAAALEIKASIRKFQWDAAIAEKGADCARYHFGVGAQTVAAIMARHGLDASQYGFFCYDAWDATPAQDAVWHEVDGVPQILHPAIEAQPAGGRYGIRYEELCMFILAAI